MRIAGRRDEELGPDALDLDLVADLVMRAGVKAFVDHTGGGTATLKAGPTRPDPDDDEFEIHAVVVGPGYYSRTPGRSSYGWRTGELGLIDGWDPNGDHREVREDEDEQALAHAIVARTPAD